MKKHSLSEADICLRFITPAIQNSGWKNNQIRMEYPFTDGRIVVRGNLSSRGKRKRADYLLSYKPNLPIAIVEAKKNTLSVGAGMQQALEYAEILEIPFVFSSNGDGFLFHDRTGLDGPVEQKLTLEEFPSPEALWQRFLQWKQLDIEQSHLVTFPNYTEVDGKTPRYYQQLAINRTLEAIAQGQQRCLLVMATGTGKTFTAFNIIWKLWKTRRAKRILFLADRNILVDQTMINDFRPFGEVMTRLTSKLVDSETGRVNTSYEVYLALYQAIIGGESRETIYDKFDPDFFDLIVVDECHRGSARDDSLWRTILDYFSSAIQIGLTATPKETRYTSNAHYFGKPVYQYPLKQGIDDGFLAPFRVIRPQLSFDNTGWRPRPGQTDDHGQVIEDRIYNQRDFDKTITFSERTRLVAERISHFLHKGDPMRKTIVFCETIDHAEQMRQALVSLDCNKELVLKNHRYVMRITGDSPEGKAQLDHFIDPSEPYPVIATTSKLMSTGVDAQTCQLIVLERRIESMTEFKQIIGRGTRLRTDYGKHFFTILDFRGATKLFEDPDWDGPPLQDPDFDPDNPADKQGGEGNKGDDHSQGRRGKYEVSDQEFFLVSEQIQYYGPDGEMITESLRDYTRKTIRSEYASLRDFLKRWGEEERKQTILDELLERGVLLEAVEEMVGREYDAFDLICHVAFNQPALTRRERAQNVQKRDVFGKYGETARAVLHALLDKYADQGFEQLGDVAVLRAHPFPEMGTPVELVRAFGGKRQFDEALHELEKELYNLKPA